jgi:protein AroM
MGRTMLGTLTIGQAPRRDITPILDQHIPSGVKRIDRGLLDGLSREAIAASYAAAAGEAVLVTRLADASAVQLSARKVHSALQGELDALEADGCNVVLLLCTGAFHGLRLRRAFLLEPDRIIPPAVAGIARDRRLGIIVPLASQITSESGKWKALEREPLFAAASPYTATPDAVAAAGQLLARSGAEALLLDCIGFVEAHRRELARVSDLPVILSNALMAKIVGEIVGGYASG